MNRLKRRRRKGQMGSVKPDGPLRSKPHLQWVRIGFPCAVNNGPHACWRKDIEAHHVREDGNAGLGIKPPDSDAVPLCACHHAELHSIGRVSFEQGYHIDLSEIAQDLAARSPHLRRLFAKQARSA